MTTGKAVKGCCLIFWGVLAMVAAASSWADIVSPNEASAKAVETFRSLRLSNATIHGTTIDLVYQPDTTTAIESGTIDLRPKDYLVTIQGAQRRAVWDYAFTSNAPLAAGVLERINAAHRQYVDDGGDAFTPAHYETAANLPPGTLKTRRTSYWVSETGIVGFTRSNLTTGVTYQLTPFWKALPRLTMLAVGAAQARKTAGAGPSAADPKLVEVAPYLFAWQCDTASGTCYVDAKTGSLISEADMERQVHDIVAAWSAMPPYSGMSDYSHFTLAPTFIEQHMHQNQFSPRPPDNAGLCGPTSLSMILDYWGECVSHMEVADVSAPLGLVALFNDLTRAAMFSHASTAGWDHMSLDHTKEPSTGPGYRERSPNEAQRYGYSACLAQYMADPWDFLEKSLNEHCPFVANGCDPNYSGHYIAVVGYEKFGDDGPRYVWYANLADSDFQWSRGTISLWDDGESGTNDFSEWWGRYNNPAIVARPMPVSMTLTPDQNNPDIFTIGARVRTCQRYPIVDGAWQRVNNTLLNMNTPLRGSADGTQSWLPVTISYPSDTFTMTSGNEVEHFTPSGMDSEATFNWNFQTKSGNPKRGTFEVTIHGWRVGYSGYDFTARAGDLIETVDANTDTLRLDPVITTETLSYIVGAPRPEFYIRVGIPSDAFYEVMKVKRVEGRGTSQYTYTVERHQCQTTASSHDAGALFYHYITDELFGWDVIRLDEHVARIKDSTGQVIAAMGDQGNLYIKAAKHECLEPVDIQEHEEGRELRVHSNLFEEVVAKITAAGDLYTEGTVYSQMDDLYDSCNTGTISAATEGYYLDNPPSSALMVLNPAGETGIYIDSGTALLPGEGEQQEEEPRAYGGNVRLKGRVLENWAAWDFLD